MALIITVFTQQSAIFLQYYYMLLPGELDEALFHCQFPYCNGNTHRLNLQVVHYSASYISSMKSYQCWRHHKRNKMEAASANLAGKRRHSCFSDVTGVAANKRHMSYGDVIPSGGVASLRQQQLRRQPHSNVGSNSPIPETSAAMSTLSLSSAGKSRWITRSRLKVIKVTA